MAKDDLAPCPSCGIRINKAGPGDLQLCGGCWAGMTPGERLAYLEAIKTNRQLLELKHAVENNELLAKQTARLAKVLEALLRELKEPFAGLSDLVDRWNRRIDEDRREYDEGERWKEGLAEEDDDQ